MIPIFHVHWKHYNLIFHLKGCKLDSIFYILEPISLLFFLILEPITPCSYHDFSLIMQGFFFYKIIDFQLATDFFS